MKSYLYILLAMVTLLFVLPKSYVTVPALNSGKQTVQVKSCAKSKFALKRGCAKKCIKHQTHSEQQGKSAIIVDCGQQVYAVLASADNNTSYNNPLMRTFFMTGVRNHLSPDLATDPDPPRFS
ncbi:hypothetical protein ABID22_002398 [Pontibacter aydingkolensis]|uniref:Uncharacterized protein n=1 Tax=Pontibacter aydingkolensis TaxID=1911536 RepID=A0ABS7CVV5_9BACT|nr:hypothetical protein [Pontibacter aydingkolensis]MBW7467999.1 hypothetical protein [Pontibacter aydingkolensis]